MKVQLRSLPFTGCVVCVLALTSCDATETVEADASIHVSVDAGNDEQSGPSDRSRAEWPGVRTRAEAAFAEMKGGGRTHFESRIGLQPWPEDLPTNWPTPIQARVVADATQQHADRLLLVDLPGSPDEALESYRQALRVRGYHVVRVASRQSAHELHAKRGDSEVILSFFGRKHATRLEILFVGGASG